MPNTITRQTIVDGSRDLVVKVHLLSDGSEETATALIVAADYSPVFTNCRLKKLDVITSAPLLQGILLWGADVNVRLCALTPNISYQFDWSEFGGLPNNGGTGRTGNILLTTLGLASADELTLIFFIEKV